MRRKNKSGLFVDATKEIGWVDGHDVRGIIFCGLSVGKLPRRLSNVSIFCFRGGACPPPRQVYTAGDRQQYRVHIALDLTRTDRGVYDDGTEGARLLKVRRLGRNGRFCEECFLIALP